MRSASSALCVWYMSTEMVCLRRLHLRISQQFTFLNMPSLLVVYLYV